MRQSALRLASFCLALCALPVAGCRTEASGAEAQRAAVAESGLALVPLQVASGARRHAFTVEVAASEEEQQRALMFRQSLAPDRGMIFPFPRPRLASFWMRNTFIPLDIIFVRTNGSIARIADNTIPESLEPVAVDEPVGAVLEIAGGRAAELGIIAGDRVSWPGFPRTP